MIRLDKLEVYSSRCHGCEGSCSGPVTWGIPFYLLCLQIYKFGYYIYSNKIVIAWCWSSEFQANFGFKDHDWAAQSVVLSHFFQIKFLTINFYLTGQF